MAWWKGLKIPLQKCYCRVIDVKKVFIMRICPDVGCPRIAISGKKAVLRDDYKGGFSLNAILLKKLPVR